MIRFSTLKHMGRSPAHYKQALETPFSPTPAMLLGTIVHGLVLGHRCDELVIYDGDRRGKAWADFKAAYEGCEIVTAAEVERAKPIADAVLRDPVAAPFLLGQHERTLHWERAGMSCRGTPDVIGADHIADLKTTNDARPWAFQRQALKMAYHAQLEWYHHAAAENGLHLHECVLVAVETSAPYAVTVLRLTDRALDAGRRMNSAWLQQLRVCEESGEWPGYAQRVLELDVPDDDELILTIDGEEIAT